MSAPLKVESTATVASVIAFMNKHRIISVPVHSAEFEDDVGVLAVEDLLGYFAKCQAELANIDKFRAKFFDTRVGEVLEYTEHGIIYAGLNDSIHGLIGRMLSTKQNRVVVETNKEITALVTQYDFLKFFDSHWDQLHLKNYNGTVSSLPRHQAPWTLSERLPAATVFQAMAEKKLSSCVLVNEMGVATGLLSTSLVTTMSPDDWFIDLFLPAADFCARRGVQVTTKPIFKIQIFDQAEYFASHSHRRSAGLFRRPKSET
jgi:CBS domain-containing protein